MITAIVLKLLFVDPVALGCMEIKGFLFFICLGALFLAVFEDYYLMEFIHKKNN